MAKDPQLEPPPLDTESAEMGKPSEPSVQPPAPPQEDDAYAQNAEIDVGYWLGCMDDAERAEKDWRARGREIIEIYRNEGRMGRLGKLGAGPVTFNILFSNTEIMLPAIYSKTPTPIVRSRFIKTQEQMQPPVFGMGAPPGAPGAPGMPPPPIGTPPGAPPMGGPPIPPMEPPPPGPPAPTATQDLAGGASPLALDAGMGAPPPPPQNNLDIGINITGLQPPPAPPPEPLPPPPPTVEQPMPFGALPGAPPPPMPGMPMPAPGRPPQQAIEAAASIMEKALDIVMDDEHSNESIKLALKDVLLPGRGVCRVRWQPEMETQPVEDPVMGGQLALPDGTPQTQDVKVWERVSSEFVYWEDLLVDPVRDAEDTDWIAFRHLFSEKQLDQEFAGSPKYEALKAAGKVSDILRWTEESAAKSPVGGGSSMKTAEKLGGHRRKAMVWEIWDRQTRQIIWFIKETNGLVLRVDPDSYQLQGFFPIPVPVLSIRTTDSRIPRPFYDLYARLAQDLDETSARISDLIKQIKVRGGYNSASREIAGILRADDGKMLPVDGVDMINGGLQNHIWMVPIDIFVGALEKLYLAREQTKQAIYEVMGISDLMRGSTKASETATAQRIKGSMGMVRLEDLKQTAGNFVRDLMRLKAELIAQNFDAVTLEKMTGEEVTPEVEAILRDDFARTCSIDIEADSTVEVDMQAEQEAMAMTMQAVSSVMQGAQQMLMTQIMPPPQVMNLSLEMLKMFLHPIRYSRGVVELIEDAQEQLQAQMAMLSMMPPMPPAPPGGPPPPGAAPGPKPSAGGPVGRSNGGAGSPPGGNGAAPPSIPNGQGLPPMPPGAMQ